MLGVVKLLDIQSVVLKFDKGAFVVVDIAVVGRRKNGDDCREIGLAIPLVHFVPFDLGLVGSYY